ncbi:DUF4307 domain-containing protein [Actinosynnema sp. ALI-1.44]|uniref:DUF4307 domain-containing protein n=1 Tax=Actinosynnema sp. ALI-1.44 TaxID=1933779 RepID=UPI001EDB269F|nr:DUF4307 domain-containing protein [Actinosynnema sp. ALI-1.44]
MESRVTLPEGRYGSRARPPMSRTRKWALTGVGLILAGGIAFVAYSNLGSAPIDAERTAFSPAGPDTVKITFTVTRDEPGKPAVCVVRARVRDGSEGGRKEVLIPPGESTVSTVIKSSGEPVTADVYGCSYQVPSYLSTEARPTE